MRNQETKNEKWRQLEAEANVKARLNKYLFSNTYTHKKKSTQNLHTLRYSLLLGKVLLLLRAVEADGYNEPPVLDFSASCNDRAMAEKYKTYQNQLDKKGNW